MTKPVLCPLKVTHSFGALQPLSAPRVADLARKAQHNQQRRTGQKHQSWFLCCHNSGQCWRRSGALLVFFQKHQRDYGSKILFIRVSPPWKATISSPFQHSLKLGELWGPWTSLPVQFFILAIDQVHEITWLRIMSPKNRASGLSPDQRIYLPVNFNEKSEMKELLNMVEWTHSCMWGYLKSSQFHFVLWHLHRISAGI